VCGCTALHLFTTGPCGTVCDVSVLQREQVWPGRSCRCLLYGPQSHVGVLGCALALQAYSLSSWSAGLAGNYCCVRGRRSQKCAWARRRSLCTRLLELSGKPTCHVGPSSCTLESRCDCRARVRWVVIMTTWHGFAHDGTRLHQTSDVMTWSTASPVQLCVSAAALRHQPGLVS
jgi:hypothetical protein